MKTDKNIVLEKKKIRLKIKNLLNNLSEQSHKQKSKIITDTLLKTKEYINAETIFIYFPFRKEIDTREIIKDALVKNKKIVLPKVFGNEIKIFFITDVEKDLRPGSFDMLEPDLSKCREADLRSVDLVIVPGLCFDSNFNRLGYGGGFYDKILEKLDRKIKKIALAFDLQILDNVPACSHDKKIDIIITESNIYKDFTLDS